jgi:hypothetical protein
LIWNSKFRTKRRLYNKYVTQRCGNRKAGSEVEENNNKYVAQDKIKELEVLIQKLIRFSVDRQCSHCLATVFTYMYVTRVVIPV